MKAANLLFKLPAALGSAALLCLALMLLAEVISRAFGAPLLGIQDLTESSLVLVTFGALAALEWDEAHIRVDLLATKLPPKLFALADALYVLLAAGLWVGLAYCLIEAASLSRLLGLASNILGIPKAPMQWLAAALIALAGLAAILRLTLRGANHGA